MERSMVKLLEVLVAFLISSIVCLAEDRLSKAVLTDGEPRLSQEFLEYLVRNQVSPWRQPEGFALLLEQALPKE